MGMHSLKDRLFHHHTQLQAVPSGEGAETNQPAAATASAVPGGPPGGYRSVLYFCNWAIYARKHFPNALPADRITHILYAFANIEGDTGRVHLSDEWADKDCYMGATGPGGPADIPNEEGHPNGGCFGEFYKIRTKHKQFRVLLSIGGWSYSANFTKGVDSEEKRKNFAKTAVRLVEQFGLDGLDLDWEYPAGPVEAQQYVELLREVRLELDSSALRQGLSRDQYDLTVATSAGPEQFQKLDVKGMDQYLTFWNLMTYDFAGPWSREVDHQSNLFGGDLSGDRCVNAYIGRGATPSKLVLGLPLYGRAFQQTDGLGSAYNGTGPGSWEDGVWDYKSLPLSGAKEEVDKDKVAAYCYDKSKKTFVTYDNAETAKLKAQYIKERGLGGVMFWESSADFPVGNAKSIIEASTDNLVPLSDEPNSVQVRR